MPVVRGLKNLNGLPPNVYVNELAAPQGAAVLASPFVLGFIGEFDRGPVDQYVHIVETPTMTVAEAAEIIFGLKTFSPKGNQLLDHLDHARVKNVIFGRVIGSGFATASLTLKDRQATPADTLKIKPKAGPGKYANIFTSEVQEGTNTGTFKLILISDIGGKETYDNLSMDPTNERYVVTIVNNASAHFVVEDLKSNASSFDDARPAVLAQTQLAGGSDGAPVTATDYIGTSDPGSGARTGLKLFEGSPASILTDVSYIDFSGQTADDALRQYGEKHNIMTYCGTSTAKMVDAAATYRQLFDTDFMHMNFGRYKSTTGQYASGACVAAIVHAIGNIEDSGLAVECSWIAGAETEVDFDMATTLYNNQIGAFELKPSAKGDGSMAYRMSNDYTLAVKDVEGNVISDNENRKVNKRRLSSWIEKALFGVAAPWQGKAMTKKMKGDAEIKLRTYLDGLKNDNVIEDYSISFNDAAAQIDQFVDDVSAKYYNTAEWTLLNFRGGTNVEV
ncbi:phage tail protein [Aneurinibacillus terranovensis]|uniref:phage tail protein n=1 Tax=Aneurinibacillus terranovensis TaxID=278991 RepID=UPI0004189318|nr:phage tail protein [Aneurinibacillus terranovensis]